MYYFAYDTNLSKEQMRQHCPGSKSGFLATLYNYKLIFIGWSRQWRGGTASIRRANGERVLGAVYTITPECLQRLDRIQGGNWQQLNIAVNNEDGEQIKAITYVNMKQTEETRPSPEYLAVIQQGYTEWANT